MTEFNSRVCPTGELKLLQLAEDCKRGGGILWSTSFSLKAFLLPPHLPSTPTPSLSPAVVRRLINAQAEIATRQPNETDVMSALRELLVCRPTPTVIDPLCPPPGPDKDPPTRLKS